MSEKTYGIKNTKIIKNQKLEIDSINIKKKHTKQK